MANNLQTFSKRIKDELVLNEYTLEEKQGILSAFINSVGSISIFPKFTLRIQTSSAKTTKFIYSLLKELYGIIPNCNYTKQLRLDKNTIYHIEADQNIQFILKELEISDGLEKLSPQVMLDDSHFRGYCIGLFLANGQVSDPKGKTYYCELSFQDEKLAKLILKKLSHFKEVDTMDFKMIKRRNRYVLYLKKSDQISVFLSFIGAIELMFEFENARIDKDTMNVDNRLNNCTQANYFRSLKTGEANLEDIKTVEEFYGESHFSDKVKVIVDLRKEKKDISYKEIADKLCENGNYISKSGVAHIFKKINLEAEKIRQKEKELKNN